jgi:hypothetical protein
MQARTENQTGGLQPNMDIRLHIVAPDERREKVFREMLRPVFSLLDRGPPIAKLHIYFLR